jgi:hypothetical protein
MQGNAPVILVVSRPSSGEAYWVSIKDCFADLERRKSKKIRFEKSKSRFSPDAAGALVQLAAREESGIYLAPPPLEEHLCLNLLPIRQKPQVIYSAETSHRKKETVWAKLEELGVKHAKAWFLTEGKLISFYDLRQQPWKKLCNSSKADLRPVNEWAESDKPEKIKQFVQLLTLALREQLGHRFVRQ